MIQPSSSMEWFKRWSVKKNKKDYIGVTVLFAFDNIGPLKRPTEKPLRLALQDVYKIKVIELCSLTE